MDGVIKIIFPFFSTTKNYDEMLQRLATIAFYETYFVTLLLRSNSQFDAFFKAIETWGPVGKAVHIVPHADEINLSGIATAFVVALLTLVFQFHDRISDVFGIRRRFDRKSILIPLAELVSAYPEIDEGRQKAIAKNRDRLMRSVFYKYASSRADKPLVDKHDIEHALNAWSWFWVCIEGVFYFGIGATVAWYLGSHDLALGFGAISITLFFVGLLQRTRLGRYARPQIESIARDRDAASDIKKEFNAI